MRSNEELKQNYSIESWQRFHVTQLAYIRNLFIILSTAFIGFIAKLILDKDISNTFNLGLIKSSGLIFLISLIIGIVLSVCESRNYRLKYKISRMILRIDEKMKIENDEEFRKVECKCTCLESLNKILFYSQLVTFLLAATFVVVFMFNYKFTH